MFMMKTRKVILSVMLVIPAWAMASASSEDPNIIRMPTMITEPGAKPQTPLDCIFMHSEVLLEYTSKPSDKKFEYGVSIVRELMSDEAANNIEAHKDNVASDERSMDLFFTVAFSNIAERCVKKIDQQ